MRHFVRSAFDTQEATQTALKLCQRGILRYLIVQFTDELSGRKKSIYFIVSTSAAKLTSSAYGQDFGDLLYFNNLPRNVLRFQ